MTAKGFIKLFTGPMYSGKTEAVLRELSCLEALDVKSALICHSSDIRNSASSIDGLTSHRNKPGGIEKTDYFRLANLDEFVSKDYEVIAIDEAQFFPDIVYHILKWKDQGKLIIVAGLLFTSEGKNFGELYTLLAFAEEKEFLKALCIRCKREFDTLKDADMTLCLVEKHTDVLVGSSVYEAVCYYHWRMHQKEEIGLRDAQLMV